MHTDSLQVAVMTQMIHKILQAGRLVAKVDDLQREILHLYMAVVAVLCPTDQAVFGKILGRRALTVYIGTSG